MKNGVGGGANYLFLSCITGLGWNVSVKLVGGSTDGV